MARSEALLRLHKALMGRRNELRRRLGMDMADLGNTQVAAASGDSADAAFDAGSEELASQLVEMEAGELGQIERALTKLKQGSYGTCEGCGQKIPVMRLNALPYSTLCIKCQREQEHDAGWLNSRAGASWEKVSDESMDDHREVDISDLELDISK